MAGAAPRLDVLIAGGGVSGLSLAAHLARELPELSVLVVDKNPRDIDERNLSYWATGPTPFDRVARGEWADLDVKSDGVARRCPLGPFRYRSLLGADFARAARALCAAAPSVSLIEGDVTAVRCEGESARLEWNGGAAEGRWLFDGRVLADDSRPRPGGLLLRQHFLGWEVATPDDRFDAGAATFLDFRAPQRDAVRFFYLLPFSPRRALVELVCHGVEPDEALLADYLARHCGVERFELLATESGASPLTDRVHTRRLGQCGLAIGIHGGRLKASTGYAFTRIQRDSQAIVSSLRRHGHPFDLPRPRRLFRLLDRVLLGVMRARPEAVGPAFEAMFRDNPIERILRFLDEDTSFWETLWVALRMPPGAFLVEVANLLLGRSPPPRALPPPSSGAPSP